MTGRVVNSPGVLSEASTMHRLHTVGSFDGNEPRNFLALRALVDAGFTLVGDAAAADAIWVGHPPLRSLPAARRTARKRPVVVNAVDGLVDELGIARRQLLRLADLVVAESAAGAAAIGERAGLSAGRLASCPTGADDRIFVPPWSAAVPFTCLVFDADTALVTRAAEAVPEARFRIVGRASGEYASNVELAAPLSPTSLGHEVRRAGCVISTVPASGRAMPPGALEALSCGTPLVTADTPAARELLADGESALLVSAGDDGAIARAASRLNADFDLARRLSAGGLATFREQAGLSARAHRWRALIESQIGTASRRR